MMVWPIITTAPAVRTTRNTIVAGDKSPMLCLLQLFFNFSLPFVHSLGISAYASGLQSSLRWYAR